jgi:hypothetical protein
MADFCTLCGRYHDGQCPPACTPIWPMPQYGWTCPKCYSVYSPSQIECYRCNKCNKMT